MNIYCCGCRKQVLARLTSGKEIYPHRQDLSGFPFWVCDTCGNYVGCHHRAKGSTAPLGSIPTPEIRKARQQVHQALDPVWKRGTISRKELYQGISKALGREYHTAEIRTVEEAREVLALLKSYA